MTNVKQEIKFLDGPQSRWKEFTFTLHVLSEFIKGFTRCGIIRTGGLNDTGDAHAPYKETCVEPLGSNRPPCPTEIGRAHV